MLDTSKTKLAEQQQLKEKLSVSPQELMDQQKNLNRLSQQLQMIRQQIVGRTNRRRSQELTKQYFESIPDGSRTYVNCGRAFIHREQDDVKEDLKLQMAGIDEEVPKLQKAFDEIQERYNKASKEFEDVVKHLPRKP